MMRLILFFTLFSCSNYSNLSENLVKRGSFNLKGLVTHQEKINESLRFERLSWYQELTLLLDFIYIKVPIDSPFQAWFSESEKEIIGQCRNFFVYLGYFLDSNKIAYGNLKSQLESYGYEEVSLPNFSLNFKLHPDYQKESLHLYKIHGACLKGEGARNPSLNFPGFTSQNLF
ncbi:MAG: hypothetical protein ACO20H_07420 [Bacteriovoracaceae bacterium]